MPRAERGWFVSAFALVAAVTLARLVLLAFDRTDPFVDEVQYWLWGQSLDWGYYSKPPLIAWVMRAVTDLAGSDAPFWLRMPGAVFHGVTALVLGGLAARLYGAGTAVWVAAGYVTLPMVTVGSLLFSTDTVMVPFLAGALLFWHRASAATRAARARPPSPSLPHEGGGRRWLHSFRRSIAFPQVETNLVNTSPSPRGEGMGVGGAAGGLLRDALFAGFCAGLAALAKYAGIYLLPGLVVMAMLSPAWRVTWGQAGVFVAAFAVVLSPNVVWNVTHDLTTLSHTADNAAWVREGARFSVLSLARFWAEQFAVAGPLVAGAFVVALARFARPDRALVGFALLVLGVVSVQAFLGGANANWAVAAWVPGCVVAMAAMTRRWRLVSLVVNGTIALALPLLTLFPEAGPEGKPLLQRYLGRADLSRQIIAAAGGLAIVSDRRDVLADLFYTGRGQGLVIYARPYTGRPRHFYEQRHPLPGDMATEVLLVSSDPGTCATGPGLPLATEGGAYAGQALMMWHVRTECLLGH